MMEERSKGTAKGAVATLSYFEMSFSHLKTHVGPESYVDLSINSLSPIFFSLLSSFTMQFVRERERERIFFFFFLSFFFFFLISWYDILTISYPAYHLLPSIFVLLITQGIYKKWGRQSLLAKAKTQKGLHY